MTEETVEVERDAFIRLSDEYVRLVSMDDRIINLMGRQVEYTMLLEDVKRELVMLRVDRDEQRRKMRKTRDRLFRQVPNKEDKQ